jgi:hypothetical protein
MTKKVKAIYQLRVTLRDIEPEIWRTIQVAEDTKLPRLHRILQILFNWEDYHLHDFIVGRRTFSVPDPEDEEFERKVLDERNVQIKHVLTWVGSRMLYVYDFGDNWQHDILLEAILLPDEGAFYPRCVAGARNAPPEDVGGTGGYGRYLEALADAEHEEHENMLRWRGEFDSEAFSLDEVNAALRRTFYRRARGGKAAGLEGSTMRHVMRRTSRSSAATLESLLDAEPPKKRVPAGTRFALELTDRERQLIVMHTNADDVLTRRLRVVGRSGEPAVCLYTLDELEDLEGHVAAERNHTKDAKLRRELSAVFVKISDIVDRHEEEDDG